MLIIFDLDGTLIDSSKDLALSVNATREHAGLPPLDAHVINSYVGNGAATLVRRALGSEASEQAIGDALKFFLKFYRKHSLEHTKLYPDVKEMVEAAWQRGHTLAVLTNKPTMISFDIIFDLKLGPYFTQVYGGDSLPAKKPDPIGIHALMKETQYAPEQTLMVGDSNVDVQTARNARVRSCGVLWGFQPDCLRAAEPDLLVSRPLEILHHLIVM